jgi:hypothetical protein
VRPADALAYRAAVVQDARRLGDNNPELGCGVDGRGYSEDILGSLPDAPCYFVSDEMTALARHAGPSMPLQQLRIDDAPSEKGFMLFDAPIAHAAFLDIKVPISAVAWLLCRDALRITVRADGVGPPPCTRAARPGEDADYVGDCFDLYLFGNHERQLVPLDWFQLDVGDFVDWKFGRGGWDGEGDPYPPVRATWSIMQQTLLSPSRSVAELAHLSHSTKARARRMGRLHLPGALTIVRLRRFAPHDEHEDDGASKVDWSHRWMVTGHWRNQWLPSIGAHRLQWISPHIKGPRDRPLVIKQRVTAWVR